MRRRRPCSTRRPDRWRIRVPLLVVLVAALFGLLTQAAVVADWHGPDFESNLPHRAGGPAPGADRAADTGRLALAPPATGRQVLPEPPRLAGLLPGAPPDQPPR